MRSHRPYLQFVAGLAVVLLLAGSANAASVSPKRQADPAENAPPVDSPIVNVGASVQSGWASLTSPWLGYTIELPTSWSFMGHVAPADSRTPHDMFAGTAGDSAETSMLVVGCRDGVVPPRPDARVVMVDGVAFTESPAVDAGDGRIAVVAEGIKDGRTWYLTACMPNDAAAPALFDEILATFHFPESASQ